MAEERSILLKVELDVDQLNRNADLAEAKLQELIPAMQKIKEEQGTSSRAYKEAQLEVKTYNKILTDSVKALKANEEANKNGTGSLKQMRESLAAAKVEFQNLSQEARESEVGQRMAADMLELKSAITDVEKSFGTFTGEVGNYQAAIKEAISSNGDLSKSMKDIKKEMDSLEDSGQGNSEQFKELSLAYETAQVAQKKLSGDMEHLGDEIVVEVSGSISKMEDRLYELALAGDTTSAEFVQLQKQTAEYKKLIVEVDASVDQLAESGGALGSALQLGEGVVSGFQAVTGATALLGGENEALLETLVKLEAAQAVLNSLETAKIALDKNAIKFTQLRARAQNLLNLAVGNGTKATKLFRGALLATGIGALIIGVGLLIANFDKLKAMLGGVSKAQQISNEAMSKAIEAAGDELNAMDKLSKKINEGNISRNQQMFAIRELQEEYPHLLSNLDAESASLEDVNKALALNSKLTLLKAQQDAIAELRVEEFKKQIQAQTNAQTGANMGWTAWILSAQNAEAALTLHNAQQEESISLSTNQIGVLDELTAGIDKQIAAVERLMGSQADRNRFTKIREKLEKEAEDKAKKAADERAKEAEAAAKRAAEIAKMLRDAIIGEQELSLANERAALEAHYSFLESVSEGNAEELVNIQRDKNRELKELEAKELAAQTAAIELEYSERIANADENADLIASLTREQGIEIEGIENAFRDRRIQRETDANNRESELLTQRTERRRSAANEIALIEAELTLLNNQGTALEFNSWVALQDERVRQAEAVRDKELQNTELTEIERVAIVRAAELEIQRIKKETFDNEVSLNDQRRQEQVSLATSALSSAQQLSDAFFQIQANQTQLELNANQEKYNAQTELLQSQLDAGLISQAEFINQKSELDAEQLAKERKLKTEQFKRDKAAQLINAAIGTAIGVVNGLAAPPPLGVIMAGVAAALGAAQIAIIASQPTPTFAAGGQAPLKNGTFGGNLHSSGGTKGVFSDGTNVEVERDEAFFILNRRATAAIGQLSAHNQKHGGAPLMRNGGTLKFQTGGVFASNVSRSADDRYSQQNAIIQAMKSAPAPIVLVEDMNAAQSNLVSVQQRAEF